MACSAGVRALGVSWGFHAPDALTAAGALAILPDFAAVLHAIDIAPAGD